MLKLTPFTTAVRRELDTVRSRTSSSGAVDDALETAPPT